MSTRDASSDSLRPRPGDRPEPFSTYAPRDTVRRLKVVAALQDVPLWTLVVDAMEEFLERFERDHGRLPRLDRPGPPPPSRES